MLYCHAGCDARDVIAELVQRGLWPGRDRPEPARVVPIRKFARDRSPADDLARAKAILRESHPITGTLAVRYLEGRDLHATDLPTCLRFHPALWHSRTRENWPAMVAPLRDIRTNEIVGVHRTFLARDGRGKAPIEPPRMVLGRRKGACIKLTADEDVAEGLHIGEGIETCVACMQRDFPADVGVRRRRRHPRLPGAVRHRVPDHRGRSRSCRAGSRAGLRRAVGGGRQGSVHPLARRPRPRLRRRGRGMSEDEEGNVIHFEPRPAKPDAEKSRVANPLNLRRELQHNALTKGLVGFNEFSHEIMLLRPIPRPNIKGPKTFEPRAWTDADDTALAEHFNSRGFLRVGRNLVRDVIELEANSHPFHPVRDYLEGLHMGRHAAPLALPARLLRC